MTDVFFKKKGEENVVEETNIHRRKIMGGDREIMAICKPRQKL
jgi:hypothetical protein